MPGRLPVLALNTRRNQISVRRKTRVLDIAATDKLIGLRWVDIGHLPSCGRRIHRFLNQREGRRKKKGEDGRKKKGGGEKRTKKR